MANAQTFPSTLTSCIRFKRTGRVTTSVWHPSRLHAYLRPFVARKEISAPMPYQHGALLSVLLCQYFISSTLACLEVRMTSRDHPASHHVEILRNAGRAAEVRHTDVVCMAVQDPLEPSQSRQAGRRIDRRSRSWVHLRDWYGHVIRTKDHNRASTLISIIGKLFICPLFRGHWILPQSFRATLEWSAHIILPSLRFFLKYSIAFPTWSDIALGLCPRFSASNDRIGS